MSESWEEERSAFMSSEIGSAVIDLVTEGVVIGLDTIVERLEHKRKSVGNTIHKGILYDAAEFVRKGR